MAVIAGAAITAAAALGGSAMSARSASKNIAMQKRFAKKGLQWRVADARKAGLHPLYAVGAQGLPQFTPVQNLAGEGLAQAGQDIGNAISRRMTPSQKAAAAQQLQLHNATLSKLGAETRYIETEIARINADRLARINEQIAQPIPEVNGKESGSPGTIFGGQAIKDANGVPTGFITPKAPGTYSATSTNPGIAAGTTPVMRQFRLPDGLPIMLPGGMEGDPSEALESLTESPMMLWAVYKANREHYGPEWASKFRARYMWGDRFESFWKWSARNRGRSPAPRTAPTRQDYR